MQVRIVSDTVNVTWVSTATIQDVGTSSRLEIVVSLIRNAVTSLSVGLEGNGVTVRDRELFTGNAGTTWD